MGEAGVVTRRAGYTIFLCGTQEPPPGPFRGEAGKGTQWDKEMLAKVLACPREAEHQYGPPGYIEWHGWAEASDKAGWHKALCECGLWLLMVPKPGLRHVS